MAAFVIVIMEEITDPSALAEYRRIGIPSLKETNVKFRVRPGPVKVLEGWDAEVGAVGRGR